jgi:hypothetical protein
VSLSVPFGVLPGGVQIAGQRGFEGHQRPLPGLGPAPVEHRRKPRGVGGQRRAVRRPSRRRARPDIAQRVEAQLRHAAERAGLEPLDEAALGDAGRQGLVVVAVAQRHEIADPGVEERVPLGPADADVAFQKVGIGEAVGREIAVVGHPSIWKVRSMPRPMSNSPSAKTWPRMSSSVRSSQVSDPVASIRPVRKACR